LLDAEVGVVRGVAGWQWHRPRDIATTATDTGKMTRNRRSADPLQSSSGYSSGPRRPRRPLLCRNSGRSRGVRA